MLIKDIYLPNLCLVQIWFMLMLWILVSDTLKKCHKKFLLTLSVVLANSENKKYSLIGSLIPWQCYTGFKGIPINAGSMSGTTHHLTRETEQVMCLFCFGLFVLVCFALYKFTLCFFCKILQKNCIADLKLCGKGYYLLLFLCLQSRSWVIP